MTEEGKEIIGAMKEMFGVLNDKITSLDDKVTSLESGQQELKNEMKEVKQDVSEIKHRVARIETTLENETNRNIRLLVDGHIQNADKLDRLQPLVEDVEYIKLKADVIEAVTKVHSYDINYLKKAK